MKSVGIIGGSGITGGELIDLVLIHPHLHLKWIYSTTRANQPIISAHPQLIGRTDLKFSGSLDKDIDIVFLCLGHGHSKKFLDQARFEDRILIIDLSNEFRLTNSNRYNSRTFVYGLPELNAPIIASSNSIANPGCFATGIQLALLPLSSNNLLSNHVHINAITGSTGAGIKPQSTSHFSWRNNNLSWYKPFVHQHLDEIKQHIKLTNKELEFHLLPIRGNFTRGIFTTCYMTLDLSLEDVYHLYQQFYKDHPFTHISKSELHLKQVINTGNCILHLHKHNRTILITCIIDNLLKGASSQAIENLNIMLNINRTTGLSLKPSVY
ncbi:MAG: N-acetyl-gamma-glutamyl-phosphate reductase [Flavobacteriaceae bacterium]|nr:N-acetyl-gamma-glutamyl-phosphate reductase [Flavobacteriaceae bacterium]